MAVSQPPGLGFGGSWSSFGGASEEVPTPPTTPSLPPPPPGAAPPSLESLRRQLDSPAPAPSVVGPPSRQRSYGTLGERLGEGPAAAHRLELERRVGRGLRAAGAAEHGAGRRPS